MKLTPAQQKFVAWLQKHDRVAHGAFMAALKAKSDLVQNLGAATPEKGVFDSVTEWFGKSLDKIASTAETLIPKYNAHKLDQAEIKRQIAAVKAGTPPNVPAKATGNPPPTPAVKNAVEAAIAVDHTNARNFAALMPLAIGAGVLLLLAGRK